MTILSAHERRRLERMAVRLDRRVGAGFSGAHRSRQRGRSLDVADWREYRPGDDVRTIDVQAWARLDQVVVRLFEADVDLSVQLLVDTSASMGVGGKLDQARRVAAAIGVIVLARNESLSLSTLAAQPPMRFRARTAVAPFLDRLGQLEPAGPTPMSDRSRAILAARPRRGLIVVISDFLTDEWDDALGRLAARGDQLVAVCIHSVDDDRPDLAGQLQLVDVETGQRVNLDASPDLVETFAERRRSRRDALRSRVLRRGGTMIDVDTADDLFASVTPALLRSGIVT